ncbi:MAG TPA: universal stress protein [Burkholderiales bacterium]|nr:universal stress protein [Burkholderiales bacterium]
MGKHRILVPVDGSERCNRAVKYVISLSQELGPAEIHLINVEPAPVGWQTHDMARETIQAHAKELAMEASAGARALLDEAGLKYSTHTEMGSPAETIARVAKELDCDSIVMGTHGRTVVGKLVLGSVASDVLHLVDVPVTLVK